MAAVLAGDDLARSLSSLPLGNRSSSIAESLREVWESLSEEVFSRSNRQNEEEEELEWAAIERLPTYDRLRKGMMKKMLDDGKIVCEEIDVANLGIWERKLLMEKRREEKEEKFREDERAGING